MSVEQITQEALALTDAQRASLAHALLQSLESEQEDGVEEAWNLEIERRVESVRGGLATGRPAAEVFEDLRLRLRK